MRKSTAKPSELQRGMVIGAYQILSESFYIAQTKRYFVLTRCGCDKLKVVRCDQLHKRNTCICGQSTTGAWNTNHHLHETWKSWQAMLRRVDDTSGNHKVYYSDRGISVCESWRSFDAFVRDIGKRPSSSHTLDRIDGTGDYCKENCRWATSLQQGRNKSNNVVRTFRGITAPVSELSELFGVDKHMVFGRIKRGWSIEAAMTYPKYPRRRYDPPPQDEFEHNTIRMRQSPGQQT